MSRARFPACRPLSTKSGVTIAIRIGVPSTTAPSITTTLDSLLFKKSPISRMASGPGAEVLAATTLIPSTSTTRPSISSASERRVDRSSAANRRLRSSVSLMKLSRRASKSATGVDSFWERASSLAACSMNNCSAARPVTASIRRIPPPMDDSPRTNRVPTWPVAETWVPPQTSTLKESPLDMLTMRTTSPYRSPKKAKAPWRTASA